MITETHQQEGSGPVDCVLVRYMRPDGTWWLVRVMSEENETASRLAWVQLDDLPCTEAAASAIGRVWLAENTAS